MHGLDPVLQGRLPYTHTKTPGTHSARAGIWVAGEKQRIVAKAAPHPRRPEAKGLAGCHVRI